MKLISKDVIPHFQTRPVYANVMPPMETKFAIAGMNPDAIKDLATRKKYINAIEENSENARINSRQRDLRTALRLMEISLHSFLLDLFKRFPECKGKTDAFFSAKDLENLGIKPFRSSQDVGSD